ncbi:hypothetical protein [Legionella rubrilucens]|uniref:hypothetical protein n=1 Tax=Legionella rubrilucens TaxID=458 RepID=UPI001ED99E5C|nr:hypothetical protein [Legionella rubrilucens]
MIYTKSEEYARLHVLASFTKATLCGFCLIKKGYLFNRLPERLAVISLKKSSKEITENTGDNHG